MEKNKVITNINNEDFTSKNSTKEKIQSLSKIDLQELRLSIESKID